MVVVAQSELGAFLVALEVAGLEVAGLDEAVDVSGEAFRVVVVFLAASCHYTLVVEESCHNLEAEAAAHKLVVVAKVAQSD